MKYFIAIILLFALNGCCAPRSASSVATTVPRVWYKKVCKQDLSNGWWHCSRVRVQNNWDLIPSRFYMK